MFKNNIILIESKVNIILISFKKKVKGLKSYVQMEKYTICWNAKNLD